MWWKHPSVGCVDYAGLLCRNDLLELRGKAIKATLRSRVLVLDYSKVTFAMDEFVPTSRLEGVTDAPAIVVVRPEQHAFAIRYANKMADIGVMRDVALPWQHERILEFVETLAEVRAHREFLKSSEILSSSRRRPSTVGQTYGQ